VLAVRLATCLALGVLLTMTGRLPAQIRALLERVAKEQPAKPAAPPPNPEADRLIEQLGATDFRTRDSAEKSLRAMGIRAIGSLRKARQHTDPEVQRRVENILPGLETALLLEPKRLTIHAKKKTIRQILDELTKHTGYKIECWGNDQQVYDLDGDNVTFWEAFDRLCQSAGLVMQIGYGDNILRLNHQDSYAPYVCRDGAFRLVANSFSYKRHIDFSAFPKNTGATSRSESLNFAFTVCVEPKIPLMSVDEPQLTQALDDSGRSMLLTAQVDDTGGVWAGRGRFISRYGGGNKTCSIQTYVNLAHPSEMSRSVKIIKGSVPVTLLADQKPEVVSDDIMKAKGKKAKIGKVSFDIKEISQLPNKQYQLQLGISNDDKTNPNDYTWMNSLYYRIELQDAKGNQFNHFGSSWSSNGMNHVDLTFTYGQPNGKAEPPKKLIYYVWTLINYQVAFEFKDLPLP
jgi:hypothetical protein